MNKTNFLVQTFGDQKRWVCWKREVREGKPTKVPYMPSGRLASTINPETWCGAAEARSAIGFDGTGIVFTDDKLLLGIDLDHVFEHGHETPPYVLDFIEKANTYTEWSPSLTGAHTYLQLTAPLDLDAHKKKIGKYHPNEGYECYTNARYFTVTGNEYSSQAKPLRTVTPQEAVELLQILGYPWKTPSDDSRSAVPVTCAEQGNEKLSIDDTALLQKMFTAKNGADVLALWQGNISKYSGDDSAADMALCAHLAFWTGKDIEQMARMWRNSPLGNRPKTKDRNDYVQRTIAAACEKSYEVYREKAKKTVETPTITNRPAPVFTSLRELLDEPEEQTSWIVDGLLPSSGFSIIVAKPKVGKSTEARQVALAVARGEPFLGRHTTKGPVLYVSLEDKRGEVRVRFKRLGATGAEDLHVYIGSAPQEAYKWLDGEIKHRKPVLVIIDTLFRFVTVKNGNDYSEVTAALSPVLALARENGAHLMAIHHAGKGGRDGGDSILGSTAIFGSVDIAIILKKTSDGKRTIETEQRYGTNIEPTVLVFDDTTQTTTLGGTKEEEDIRRVADEIHNFLFDQTEPCAEKIIEEAVEGRTGLKHKALRDLVAEGTVRRTGAGKRNEPYLYSCSLVPDIYTGREKQEHEMPENAIIEANYSRSEEIQDEMVGEMPETSEYEG